MKQLFLFSAIFMCIILHAQSPNSTLPKNQPPAQAKADIDDDRDGQVVAESMGVMIQALATFSQNPHNPVVAGACALQALGAFIKMLIQIFDEIAPTRNRLSEQEVAEWFMNLPKEKQIRIMQLVVVCAQKYKIAKEV